MKKFVHKPTLEEELLSLKHKAVKGSISIKELLHTLPGKGYALIIIILSLPFCQPIQIPGMSTPFGLCVAFIGLRISFGKRAWLPERLQNVTIPEKVLDTILDKTLMLVNKMRRWIHPRLFILCHFPPIEILNGLIVAVLGLLLALPLPIPFSNLTSAWGIFFLGLGILEDDGLMVLVGYLIALLTFGFFIGMFFSVKQVI